jgi:hypothetical protein
MSSKLVFSENIPKEILQEVKDKLTKFEDVIPGWASDIRVYWRGESSGNKPISGEAAGDLAYRTGSIVFCPAFLEEKDADRDDTAVHELVHILISPLVNFYHHLLNYLPEQDEKVKAFIEEQFSEKIEGVTVDVTNAILKFYNKDLAADVPKLTGSRIITKKKKAVTRKKK